MKFLTAAGSAAGCEFSVWLDTSKGTAAEPDPAYIRTYTWGRAPTGWNGGSINGTGYTSWPEYCAAETQLLAAADLAAMQPPAPTPLVIAGTVFQS